VQWNDHAFELVKLTWSDSRFGMDQTRSYLLGPDRGACEAFVDAVCRWNHEVRGEILVFKDGCFQKSAKLYTAMTSASVDQLVLEGTFKQQILDDFTQFLTSRVVYEEHGVPWKRGALFIGPPGNGKTLCVKALIGALRIPCIYVQSFESPHATPQGGIEAVFHRARSTVPCLLVLEDIDALLVEGTRSYFLNELDGFAANTGVITLATTNHPERLDPSILERPSRFDRKYHFDLPTTPTRAQYIATWNARLAPALRLTDEGCELVAQRTDGFSFAYIQEVFVSSMMRWMTRREVEGILPVALEQVEVLRAQMQSVPSHEPPPPVEPSDLMGSPGGFFARHR
jgi:SpoVK/Ycf46/Vps4 family AAA+-type ATPase